MSSLPDLATATRTTPSSASPSTSASSARATGSNSASTTGQTKSLSQAATITGSGTTGQASGAASITGSAVTTGGALTGLPKLSGAIQPVTASVPPTANAPFMKQSALPDGTVFIVVGAILGFMAISVLLWRGLVAWSLHRSVKRAAQHQNMADTKALFRTPAPPAPFYKYSDRDSTISLSGLGHNKGGKKGARPTTATGGASTSSLFFSPTAGAAGAGLANPGNRGSNYLPAGYYASGAASAANGQSQVNLGHQPAISLSNLGPQSQGYSRARSMGPSPPDSPFIAGQQSSNHMASSSTLNLNQGYGGNERAPSAYLEDLFDGENAPPVPGQGQGHGHGHGRGNEASPGRY
ncbi:hypothetical protein ONS95_002152 [Cadophora gregata]|uniref:uncharacterized protein n=1 Tax=Cadophora gregata TaxID=51156 RepID=UPI0026DD273D|nr:uncharacterized protein ONS95_002152 [Cadophora gregata]KAK0109459.1 hypothetical protein ONS95_002152 [Cadophora gregata]KAK0110912.1 hypothetical protein ONS96_002498 [Cadophora gregata f. sp. sojae]